MGKKFISWNTESGGRRGFQKALRKLHSDPDVVAFMFQEVHDVHTRGVPREVFPLKPGNRGDNPIRPWLHQEIKRALEPEFDSWFAPQITNHLHELEPTTHHISYGQSLFVKRSPDIRVQHLTQGCIYRNFGDINEEAAGGPPSAKAMIAATLQFSDGQVLTIGNVHGFWSQFGKIDMPARFVQNRGITSMLTQHINCHREGHTEAEILLMGDFNYTSQMRALDNLRAERIFGMGGGVILNHRFGITDTRTKHYKKPIREADFAIISQALNKRHCTFTVDIDVPSDHGVLCVEIM